MGERMTGRDRRPMRVAFLSDLHGDALALDRVIADLESSEPVDEVLLGGDLAQGGPQPAEVIDTIRSRGWRSVRGNADEFLVRIADGSSPFEAARAGEPWHGPLPASKATKASWSVSQLGPDRIEYLRSLPMSIELGPYPFGTVRFVHATPWSTEEVVLPDADLDTARRMVRQAGARMLVYGHIHTQYLRKVGPRVLVSPGAVSISNDADPRPAYAVLTLGTSISIEHRRVDWQPDERRAAYRLAGLEQPPAEPGPFPVRGQPGVALTVWP
jgi:predicted phosphodiesterase